MDALNSKSTFEEDARQRVPTRNQVNQPDYDLFGAVEASSSKIPKWTPTAYVYPIICARNLFDVPWIEVDG